MTNKTKRLPKRAAFPKGILKALPAAIFFFLLVLCASFTAVAAEKVKIEYTGNDEGAKTITQSVIYQTTNPDASPLDHIEGQTTIGGKEYSVIRYTKPVIISEEETDEEAEEYAYTSELFSGAPAEHLPPEKTDIQGQRVVLKKKELKKSPIEECTEERTQTVTFTDLEGADKIPGTLDIEFENTDTEQVVIADEMKLISSREIGHRWNDDFVFPIKVTDYDADSYVFGDIEVPHGADLNDYKAEFLQYLGLPASSYRIDNIVWNGEPYEENGVLCRSALASGSKLVRDYSATYSGNVTFPEKNGYVWECVYIPENSTKQTITTPGQTIYTMSTDVTLEKSTTWLEDLIDLIISFIKGIIKRVKEYIEENPVSSALILIILSGAAAFLLVYAKTKKAFVYVSSSYTVIRKSPSNISAEIKVVKLGARLQKAGFKHKNGFIRVFADENRMVKGWILKTDVTNEKTNSK